MKTSQKFAISTMRSALEHLDLAGLELSLVTGGGQSSAVIHTKGFDLEEWDQSKDCEDIVRLGSNGVGSQICL